MKIRVEQVDEQNFRDVDRLDGAFTIDARLVLSVQAGVISYETTGVPPYQKRYQADKVNYRDYIGHVDQTIFLAYVDGAIAGQIRLRRNWNVYAYVEDLVVDVKFRRCGVGQALMRKAIEWGKGKKLAGVMLETQNNNVAACRFYERCGFRLGGFDSYLYRGLDPKTEEIALYWYLVFDAEGRQKS